jgi:phosphatidylethanolamine/phosphatidyl-N-methylethanolamine N-methyltransferase
MDHDLVRRIYAKGAGVYDVVFGPLLERGRALAVQAVNATQARRVLEVGVGTGLSLPLYRSGLSVIGIDLSREMLVRARARQSPQVLALLEMDAQRLAFADASFDCVVAMYVAAVVPDMAQFFAELRRVCVPGGDVVVVNHLAADKGILGLVDRMAAPATRALALRSDLRLATLVATSGMQVAGVEDAGIGGYIKLVRFRNSAATG